MPVLIVVESEFGNTRAVGDAIAAGVADASSPDSVAVMSPDEAHLRIPPEVTLLCVGAPTHALALPSADSRAKAVNKGATGCGNTSLAEWITEFLPHPELRVVTFDTSVSSRLSGSAAKAAVRMLRRRGIRTVNRGPSFVVTATSGPLADGELERATDWGRELAVSRPASG